MAALAIDKLVKDKDFMKEAIPVKFLKNMNGQKIFFISLAVTGGIAAVMLYYANCIHQFSTQR